jgi:hypothetical protein
VSHASRTFLKFLAFQRDLSFFFFPNAFNLGAKKRFIASYHYYSLVKFIDIKVILTCHVIDVYEYV